MELTGCLQWTIALMKATAGGHPVAEAMLIAWGFVNIVEGASGFGTPVALGAPILVELGHSPLDAISACLVMDALCTHFGAVGTPVWFGLGEVVTAWDEDLAFDVGVACSVMQARVWCASHPPMATIDRAFHSSSAALRGSVLLYADRSPRDT